jgi:hypothetical protein
VRVCLSCIRIGNQPYIEVVLQTMKVPTYNISGASKFIPYYIETGCRAITLREGLNQYKNYRVTLRD